jgi:hypothetical protein
LATLVISTNPSANESTGKLWSRSDAPKISIIIVLATLKMPIPAVTLKHSTIHNSQNWGVRMAAGMLTCCTLIILREAPESAGGDQPAGFQSGAGMR